MTEYIRSISGFVLPKTDYHIPITDSDTHFDDFLSRASDDSLGPMLKNLEKNSIYKSDIATNAYQNFISNQSAENYFKLIDIAHDILSHVPLREFFILQLTNTNTSPIVTSFCLDMSNSPEFLTAILNYGQVPSNIRYNFANSSLPKTSSIDKLKRNFYNFNLNTEMYLTELSLDKLKFVIFYKFIFADAY